MLILELLFFAKVLFISPPLEPADMVVCFEGAAGRAQAAYSLADQGYADVLVISPADENKLERYDRRFRPKLPFIRVIERRARTTFENALYTSRIVKQHHIESTILVTSWNHMPRSSLLLKMMLLGTNTRILVHPVKTGRVTAENWFHYSIGWKMICNEMVECWGSLIEFINYQITGHAATPGKWSVFSRLKRALLFSIGPKVLYPSGAPRMTP